MERRNGSKETLAELRNLILGSRLGDGDRIDELEQSLRDPRRLTEYVSRVLPDAVLLRARRDQALTRAMEAPVEEALRHSIQKNPKPIVDAIFPVMGPAIRKAVAAAIKGMVQRLEQAIEFGLSPRALVWRFTAWRTGRPFAEVVLLKTLAYRVEQVFLIHRETGLLLRHAVAESAKVKDADLVSSMLTAIQDFVRDSFDAPPEETLESLQVGDFSVWIEQDPHAVLATVIRGNAPQELRGVMRRALEAIGASMREELERFEGDASRFELCLPHLEACLLEARARGRSEVARLLLLFLGLSVLLGGGYLLLAARAQERRFEAYLDLLDAEPGLVVTRAGERSGRRFLVGLKDPLATDPRRLRERAEAPPVEETWAPYHALEPEIVVRRARALLDAPETVQLSLRGETLVAEGTAPRGWAAAAAARAPSVPGVARLDASAVLEPE
jgi:OOP family OmpA-OmpF porin